MQWPTKPDGTVDWETVFEDENFGIIPLVNIARATPAVRQITTLLVEQLFIRTGDAEERDRYRAALKTIFAEYSSLEETKTDAIKFLRSIKADRQMQAAQERQEPADAEESDAPKIDENSPEFLFHTTLRNKLLLTFKVLCDGIEEDFESPVPYILSPHFAFRFVDVVDERVTPPLIPRNKGIINRADMQSDADRAAYMTTAFEDRANRQRLYDTWKLTWTESVNERPLPKKPEKPKGGMFSKLMGKPKPRRSGKGPHTIEEWEVAAAEVEAANKAANETWDAISAPSKHYIPPSEADKEILMGLMGRTPAGIQKHITAITQIATQGCSTSAFDTYQSGRPVDLALLATSFRHPETFLGREGFLYAIMRGYKKSLRQMTFPLISRYLIDIDYDVWIPPPSDEDDEEEDAIS